MNTENSRNGCSEGTCAHLVAQSLAIADKRSKVLTVELDVVFELLVVEGVAAMHHLVQWRGDQAVFAVVDPD